MPARNELDYKAWITAPKEKDRAKRDRLASARRGPGRKRRKLLKQKKGPKKTVTVFHGNFRRPKKRRGDLQGVTWEETLSRKKREN